MKTLTEESPCPNCGEEGLYRDDADVGVGIIYGPWGCPCGWSADPRFDSTQGKSQAAKEHPDHLVFADGVMVSKERVCENLEQLGIQPPEDL